MPISAKFGLSNYRMAKALFRFIHLINFKSIGFWLFLFFAILLFGITNPPLERSHDWRQCLTNMISRNLVETSPNPMYPMVDNGGRHASNIIASEFPVFNYLVYLISVIFGYTHWYGRLINLIISTLAAWYFYKLLKLFFSEAIAFNSTFLLCISIWFSFSRKSMPDVFSVSLLIMALYQMFIFFKTNQAWRLALYGVLATLGVLAKLPAIFLLCFVWLPILSYKNLLLPKISVLVVSFFIISLSYWWYFIWGEYLFKTWGYQLFFPKSIIQGFYETLPFWRQVVEQFYYSAFQGFLAFILFWGGIFYCIKKLIKIPLFVIGLGSIVFMAFVFKTGDVFAHHNYYIIPFVPVMALLAGIGLSSLPKKWSILLLVFVSIESLANQQHDFFINPNETFKLNLEAQINKSVPLKEKIALGGSTGPQYMYFAHRKGWGLDVDQTLDTSFMNYLTTNDYKYLVIVKKEFKTLPTYKLLSEDKDIMVFDLRR